MPIPGAGKTLGQMAGTDDPPSDSGLPGPKQLLGLGMPRKTDQQAINPIGEKFETFIKQRWEDWRTAYSVFHQICWQNILYYAGVLWINWDKDRRLWYPAIPEDEYTPQPNVNEFAPAIDSMTSVFKIPEVEASPIEDKIIDSHEVAEVANVLAREFARHNGLIDGGQTANKDGVGDKAGQLFTLTGNLFTIVQKKKCGAGEQPQIETVPMMQVSCPACGLSDKLPLDHPALQPPPSAILMGQQVNPTPCPQCGSNDVQHQPTQDTRQATDPLSGKPATTPVIKWTADCKIGNPMFALPRPGSRSLSGDSRTGYIGWAERMSLDEVYSEWEFEAQPDNQFLDSMEASWELSMNYYFTGYSSLSIAAKESALVLRVFIEPDSVKEIPEGGIAVYINERVIRYDSWEDVCSQGHQLTHFGYLSMPTTFFYRTSAFDLAQVQKELNRYESIIALHGMTSSSDSLIIDENTKVSNVTGRGDRIIYWRSIGPGSKEPHRLQHGSLDNGVYEQRQRLRDALQQISGAVAVWRGQQAGSVTSAAGISQLRGQAEQMFSKPVGNWNSGWVETFKKGVKILQSVMEPWEIGELMGPGHDVQIAKFKSANLDTTLQWVASTHGLPKTRDEKRNDMLAMHDRGMLDMTDPQVQSRAAELFGETGMAQQFNVDATRARWENNQMAKGLPIQFMPDVEDLQVHLSIHGERIKRLDFEQLEDEAKQDFYQHYLETKMAYSQLMLANTESEVEYKAASVGKVAPGQGKPGELLSQGQDDGQGQGSGQGDQGTAPGQPPVPSRNGQRGGRVDGGPHGKTRGKTSVASGQSVVPTGPQGQRRVQ